MGRKVSEFNCLFDSDCSPKRICHNRKCTTPRPMGPCKEPANGEADPCNSNWLFCHGNKCVPFKSSSMKCFFSEYECPLDHWCDVANGVCVPMPDLFEFCEKEIGCRRPYICSPHTRQCMPPCTTTKECFTNYGGRVDYTMICYSPTGGDIEKNGYCEDAKKALDSAITSTSPFWNMISDVVKNIMSNDDDNIVYGDEEIIIDESINADGSVHPVTSIGSDGYILSGFNIVLILAIFGLFFYLYRLFVNQRKRSQSFFGVGNRPARYGKYPGGGTEQRDVLISKLSNINASVPVVDVSKEKESNDLSHPSNSITERTSLLTTSSPPQVSNSPPPGYGDNYFKNY